MMTELNIAEIREALATVTQGKWVCDSDDVMGVTFFYVGPRNEPESPLWMSGRIICDLEGHERESDATLIANAPEWLRQLCDLVEAQDKRILEFCSHIGELTAERHRDALDGQGALDEANNRIAELETELAEAKKDSERLKVVEELIIRNNVGFIIKHGFSRVRSHQMSITIEPPGFESLAELCDDILGLRNAQPPT